MIKTESKSLPKLIAELDDVISKYVRLDAANAFGKVTCCCCQIQVHWTQAQCSHYVPRSNMALRFDLLNLGAASIQCNQFDEEAHLKRWHAKMSHHQRAYLESKRHSLLKPMRSELEENIAFYKSEITRLRREKHI